MARGAVLAVWYVCTTNTLERGAERYTGACGVTGAASRVYLLKEMLDACCAGPPSSSPRSSPGAGRLAWSRSDDQALVHTSGCGDPGRSAAQQRRAHHRECSVASATPR